MCSLVAMLRDYSCEAGPRTGFHSIAALAEPPIDFQVHLVLVGEKDAAAIVMAAVAAAVEPVLGRLVP